MTDIIPCITLVTASVDGHIVGAYRTRLLPHDPPTLVAETIEASDMDAFTPPIDDQPGLTVEVYPQTTGNSHIPDIIWAHLWEGICERLQTRAMLRRAMCERMQINLGAPPEPTNDGIPVVANFAPKGLLNPSHHINGIAPTTIANVTVTHCPHQPDVEIVENNPDLKDYLKPGQSFPF